jgi:hypothetical protein
MSHTGGQPAQQPPHLDTAPPPPGQGPPPTPFPDGAFSPGVGPGTDLTSKLPGRLRGANIFLVVILVLGVIGALWVLNGDIGGTTDRQVFYPYHWPDDVEQVSYADEWYGVDSGGVFTAVLVLIALLFLACAAVAALVILKPGAPRNGKLIGAGLAIAITILVVTIAGGAAFDSWADGEDYNNWWLGSSYYGGITGAVLLIGLFAYPMWADRTGRRMMATAGVSGQPMPPAYGQPPHMQPTMQPGPGVPPPFPPPGPPQQPPPTG